MDFLNIGYLKDGNNRQRQAYLTLSTLGIMRSLQAYQPILVGTIPIAIDISNSDLDIICEVNEIEPFIAVLQENYEQYENFVLQTGIRAKLPYVIANFRYLTFEIEIFGQPMPTKKQNGYRHMLIENRILQLLGSSFRNNIIELKKSGIKTEPAFCQLLGITGDPFIELLKFEEISNEDILVNYK